VQVYNLDGRRITSEYTFWQEYLAVAQPDGAEYFGCNLAAFRDAVVAGGPGWPGESCHLRIENHRLAKVSTTFLTAVASIAGETKGITFELA
jgi:hypothetical protein